MIYLMMFKTKASAEGLPGLAGKGKKGRIWRKRGKLMDEILKQQMEALQVMEEYLGKLIPGMETLSGELKGSRKEDTDDFLKQCIDGMNWVVEIYNRTRQLLADSGVTVDKETANKAISALSEALKEKQDAAIADSIDTGVIPFLLQLKKAAAETVKKAVNNQE